METLKQFPLSGVSQVVPSAIVPSSGPSIPTTRVILKSGSIYETKGSITHDKNLLIGRFERIY